jgi:UDP-glucuronate 4-epimerase
MATCVPSITISIINWKSEVKKYSFLVTGIAGFISLHVAQTLLPQGARVVGLVNFNDFNDYYSPTLKRDQDMELRQYPNFVSIEGDLADLPLLQALFKSHASDKIRHLAPWRLRPGCAMPWNPFAYQKANLEGFLNFLELAKPNQVERFAYASSSSSSVYAGLTELPFAETQRVDMPISLYAATKKANELIAHSYSQLFGLAIRRKRNESFLKT